MFKGPGNQKTNAICKYKLNVEISSKSTYICIVVILFNEILTSNYLEIAFIFGLQIL